MLNIGNLTVSFYSGELQPWKLTKEFLEADKGNYRIFMSYGVCVLRRSRVCRPRENCIWTFSVTGAL